MIDLGDDDGSKVQKQMRDTPNNFKTSEAYKSLCKDTLNVRTRVMKFIPISSDTSTTAHLHMNLYGLDLRASPQNFVLKKAVASLSRYGNVFSGLKPSFCGFDNNILKTMGLNKREEVSKFILASGSKQKGATEEALLSLETLSSNGGLNELEIEELIGILVKNKLASSLVTKFFHCLVPEKSVNNNTLKKLLSWLFYGISANKISQSTQKYVIHWITGIVHFELGDVAIIDSYFHSFLHMLRRPHLESVVAKLLCLLLKPEDAKRWTVKKILELRQRSGPKAHINSMLSVLKSFRPDVVPETVPMTQINYENVFHTNFQKAYERKILSVDYNPVSSIEIKWNQFRSFDKKSAHLPRLIPNTEEINFESSATRFRNKKVSIVDIKNMASVGANCLRIEIPTQTLSLLTNAAGFHVLAFSDLTTKSRFSYKLHHTLFRVYILELEPYSVEEKAFFLDSLAGLEEYMQEGIPVVTEFLIHYLMIWDGEEFRQQILNLIQWVTIENKKDLQECFFRPLRQLFRSSGQHCKYLIIEAMGSLLRNVIAFHGREVFFFDRSASNDTAKMVEDIVIFVSELIVEGIIWNVDAGRKDILISSLDFYEICSVLEYSADFPVVLVMPPALVYGCLFSGSRVFIARLCSLMVRFWQNTICKLSQIGNPEEFSIQIQQFQIYMLDYYRCVWSNIDFHQSGDSFMFYQKPFSELCWNFQNSLGVNVKTIFSVRNSITFWDGKNNNRQNFLDEFASEYPSIVYLKKLCESEIL